MKRYSKAFEAFQTMRSKLKQSSDPLFRGAPFQRCRADQHIDLILIIELFHQYVDATYPIREVVEETIRHMPRVLIDTTTGRLYDKTRQAEAFEELPIFDELRSSMTTGLDCERIEKEVKGFYQYVMLSHKWQASEPTFQMVEDTSVYSLPTSPKNGKLQRFCELVRSLDFQWAWSDTCCVNQLDKGVQQESLVAMFRWYRGSALTIVHLLGVLSEFQEPGDLWRSIWNTRAWTYQEYVAARVVQFYTEDWKPYLCLSIFNHKESTMILAEMERATNLVTQELAALCPGLDRAREKLFLASKRRSTREEDIAYSLLGIFNASIPVIYGEGNRAVGRLLEYVLAGSSDVTILAWTGRAGDYNSCLPPDLTVYDQLVPPHIPQPIEAVEMDGIIMALHSSLPDPSLAMALHDHLHKLPSPSFLASRLGLPGIVFPVTQLDTMGSDSDVYRATTSGLREVEIKTKDDLSGMMDLLFVHPWISRILDQEFPRGAATLDQMTCSLRLVARLRQPFGALLLAPVSRTRYRRVAADCLIMAQIREETSLTELIDGIRITVDIQ